MSRLIEMIISAYSLGLIVYLLLGWIHNMQTERARTWLSRLYDPVLVKIRAAVKPINVGATLLDLSPMILLIGLVVLKGLVLYLLPRGW